MQVLRLKSDLSYNPYAEEEFYACSKSERQRNPVMGAMQILGGMVKLSVRLVTGIVLAGFFILIVAALLKFLLL